uniref:ATP synthase F0 subunit 8 n=1 Tax=Sceliphron madraspatanum TaxID=2008740 RepID=A0A343DRF6_9HYME|nr:ATP synthase F0 subunit 8 [Sceliphron madraspatanum]
MYQMMPLKWFYLFIYFTIIFLIIMTMIHFMKKIKMNKINKYHYCQNNYCIIPMNMKKKNWLMKW